MFANNVIRFPESLAVFDFQSLDQVLFSGAQEKITSKQFLQDLLQVKQELSKEKYILNACRSRYLFILGFMAGILSDKINLLPPNQTADLEEKLLADYPDSQLINDDIMRAWLESDIQAQDWLELPYKFKMLSHKTVAIIFTSGTTGTPKPQKLNLNTLIKSAKNLQTEFEFKFAKQRILSTVPGQHMFGLELSIMLCMQHGLQLAPAQPFFPEDIRTELLEHKNNILVSTPIQLKACCNSGVDLTNLDCIISSTAPLDPELAKQLEQRYAVPVYEIYGSTETGALATRRTAETFEWQMLPSVRFFKADNSYFAAAEHLPKKTQLNDEIRLQNKHKFILLQRNNDLIKIAGKRMSLSGLNNILNKIPGVIDGVFYLTESNSANTQARLVAFIHAPKLTKQKLRTLLAKQIDSVFLPRTIHFVESLPRNQLGKLSKVAMQELAHQAGAQGG